MNSKVAALMGSRGGAVGKLWESVWLFWAEVSFGSPGAPKGTALGSSELGAVAMGWALVWGALLSPS